MAEETEDEARAVMDSVEDFEEDSGEQEDEEAKELDLVGEEGDHEDEVKILKVGEFEEESEVPGAEVEATVGGRPEQLDQASLKRRRPH